MQAVSAYSERKKEFEEQIKALEEEKTRLAWEITELRENLETIKLQRKSKVLEGEVSRLRAEKKALVEEITNFSNQDNPTVEAVLGATDAAQIQPSGG